MFFFMKMICMYTNYIIILNKKNLFTMTKKDTSENVAAMRKDYAKKCKLFNQWAKGLAASPKSQDMKKSFEEKFPVLMGLARNVKPQK